MPYAVSSIDGFVNFYVSPESTGAHHILLNNESNMYYKNKNILRVQAYTLDTLLFNILRIDRVDIMKIDVEGHELEVIKGAQKLFQHNPTRLIVIETKRDSELFRILTEKYIYRLVSVLD